MILALDAMGGDFAPEEIVKGAVMAWKENQGELKIILVGDEKKIKEFDIPPTMEIVHTDVAIGMDEHPSEAFKKKKDSSIGIGIRLQKEGKADAFLSAGNTGAVVAFSLLLLGRIKGVKRPALATFFPAIDGYTLVLDVGANSDVKPEYLYQFGVMGSVYLKRVYGIENPSVGLLSMGEERIKGTSLIQQAHQMLEEGAKKGHLNFYGNIEGHDILEGKTDVCVVDGFTGNAVLKFGESLVSYIIGHLKKAAKSSLRVGLGALLMKPAFVELLKKVDYEEYGGAVLLGVDGISVVSHGKSKANAIKSAINLTLRMYRERVNEIIREELEA